MAAASNELDRLLHLGERSREVPEEERERAYEVMCRKNPREGRFGNNAGLWYRDVARDYEKSLKWYLESVQAQPDDQDYINDTALIYLFHLRDRKAESLPMFLKVVALVEEDGQEPVRGYWDTLENLCKYYSEEGQLERVVEYGDKRANEDARVNGNPYPSAKAAAWRARALRALGRSE